MSIFEEMLKVSNFLKKELKYPVPHVGWNKINLSIKKNKNKKLILNDIKNNEFMYFVHSYFVIPKDKDIILQIKLR